MKEKLLVLVRWIVGIVFVFSGFVKGIDPMGFNYKLNDYLEALHLNILEFLSFPGAFLLPFAEFAIGITLLTGILIRLSAKLAFVFMLFFTPLTLYIALKNPVTDCGCFGDALVISNWQTFYKNILLIFLVVLLLINRKNLLFIASEKYRTIALYILLLCYISVVYWSYNHEPIFDFRPYKVGASIPEGMKIPDGAPTDVYQNIYRYRNRKSNEVKQFGDSDFPWQDTINWKFESMDPPILLKKGYKPPIHDFSIQTIDQENVTDKYLLDSTFTFFVVAYDLEKSSHKKQKELNSLADWAKREGYHFIGLTSTTGEALHKYQVRQLPAYEIMFTDQTTLKTIIRSNPGLLLLKKGIIIGKWHYNDFPTPEKAEKIVGAEMNKKLNQ
ncbi:MAG: DoxX family protein [Bacteroidia bacterium]|nr:DoxX family protein [Bacteroidia bacterium]